MALKIWLDGQYYDQAEAKVSVFDHGLLYGDGVFEGTRVYDGNIAFLDEHMQRLLDSAKVIVLDVGMTKDELIKATVETCKANNLKNGYIRPIVTRGVGDLGLDPRLHRVGKGNVHSRHIADLLSADFYC
jgi:branched-chain amino acid aminotransferase